MWLAFPSPSGKPTTRVVPTSRMISSAIASGSVKCFGINIPSGATRAGIAGGAEESTVMARSYYTSILCYPKFHGTGGHSAVIVIPGKPLKENDNAEGLLGCARLGP